MATSTKKTLRILSWNVYVGHEPHEVHAALKSMIEDHTPDLMVLTEATHQWSSLEGLGYHVVHMANPKTPRHSRLQQENADTAILVRRGIVLEKDWSMRLKETWRGPKHGLPHSPRVYQVVRIRKGVQSWRVLGDHQPFGARAVAESVTRLKKWLNVGTKPSIVIGDQNMRSPEFKKRVASALGSKVGGPRIDLTAYRNCDLLDVKDLGAHGSDHHALLFDFMV